MSAVRLTVREYEPIQSDCLSEALKYIAAGISDPASKPETLGLHLEDTQPHAWWFVGQVWLELDNKRIVLRVNPRVDTAAFQMYAECVRHPLVRVHLDPCISVFWDKKPIPTHDLNDLITPLVVMRYLTLLYDL